MVPFEFKRWQQKKKSIFVSNVHLEGTKILSEDIIQQEHMLKTESKIEKKYLLFIFLVFLFVCFFGLFLNCQSQLFNAHNSPLDKILP